MPELFIGLMSGTSVDAIDAALVAFESGVPRLRATTRRRFETTLQGDLQAILDAGRCDLRQLAVLDAQVGDAFAEAALELLRGAGVPAEAVRAIGSHGQTLFHHPREPGANSLQIGDPNRIAERTGITTVADLRRRDMAAGGQGAPLVPGFHHAVFGGGDRPRVVVNIGGIANLTVLPTGGAPVTGFDCGPGNTLMDAWAREHLAAPMDTDGRWAASAAPDPALLDRLLSDPYFALPAPKSTGREHFHRGWLEQRGRPGDLEPARVQATLCELTAITIADAIQDHAPDTAEVLVCGGGAYNPFLMQRLAARLGGISVQSTAVASWEPEWVEAAAFAWLAHQTLQGAAGNVPSVTGARHPVVLGAIYPAGR